MRRRAPRSEPIANTAAAGPRAIDVAAFHALLESGDWASVIDAATGVVELSAVASAQDEANNELWVSRRCGDRAATVVRMLGVLVQKRAIDQPDSYQLGCTPDGTVVTCSQPGLGEYDLGYSFRFEQRAGAYVLTGISTVDVGTVAEAEEKKYEAELAKTGGC